MRTMTAVGILALTFQLGPIWAQAPDDGDAPAAPAFEVTSRDPGVLLNLAQQLERWGAARHNQRVALARQVESALMADAASIKAVKLGQWKDLSRLLAKAVPAENRKAWAAKLRAAFAADNAALFALGVTDVRDLVSILDALGEERAAANLAWAWFKSRQGDDKLSAAALAGVARSGLPAVSEDMATKKQLLATLDGQWAASNAAAPFGHIECGMIARLWFTALEGAKARVWAMRGYSNALGSEEGRAKATGDTANGVGNLLVEFGLTDKGKGYPAFAQVVARLAREGKLVVGYIPFLSDPLGTPETQAIVRAELLDEQGHPRVEVGKILSRSYRMCGQEPFDAWRKTVDEAIAKSGGDAKALWLLIKAAVEVQVPPRPWPMRARGFLDQALAAAESDGVRMRALKELADYFGEQKRFGEAIDMLESMRPQFQGEIALTLIVLQQELRNKQSAAESEEAIRLEAAEAGRKQGLLAHYQTCLAAARASGDAGRAATLETEIARLKAELGR